MTSVDVFEFLELHGKRIEVQLKDLSLRLSELEMEKHRNVAVELFARIEQYFERNNEVLFGEFEGWRVEDSLQARFLMHRDIAYEQISKIQKLEITEKEYGENLRKISRAFREFRAFCDNDLYVKLRAYTQFTKV